MFHGDHHFAAHNDVHGHGQPYEFGAGHWGDFSHNQFAFTGIEEEPVAFHHASQAPHALHDDFNHFNLHGDSHFGGHGDFVHAGLGHHGFNHGFAAHGDAFHGDFHGLGHEFGHGFAGHGLDLGHFSAHGVGHGAHGAHGLNHGFAGHAGHLGHF